MSERIDCAVIGAGVVGLAVARALARAGREVLVLEAEDAIGTGISSRNSEVIHAGIYYPAGSLMARLCVRGRDLLYDYCADHGVPHARCGKLIVATDASEAARLDGIAARAAANAVSLTPLSGPAARAFEPALTAAAALHSPLTGIVDSHALMLALQGDAEAAGAMLAFRAPMLSGVVADDAFCIEVGGAEPMRLSCRLVVNAAGLGAQGVARAISGMPPGAIPPLHLVKGSYFTLTGRAPFTHLIYPVPVPGGLGTHLTLDLGGQARFGPDVEVVDHLDYDVDAARAESFAKSVRRWWPGLPDGSLQPGYAGIRPKLAPPGAPADFQIQTAAEHGVPGLINLFGIESPGLTASLALAEEVAARVA